MKIVTASKFYYRRAGLEAYLFKISETLKIKGHEVIPFSTTHKKNISCEFEKYFAEYLDIGGGGKNSPLQKIKAFARIIYNMEAQNKFASLLDTVKPDIVWGFGVHRHLSPSIFVEAKKRSIPVIHRLSDYSLICPNGTLKLGNNQICTEILCPAEGYHNAIKHKCVKLSNVSSTAKSSSIAGCIAGAAELFIHNKLNLYKDNVDKFIAPSNFLRSVMIKSGIAENKITHIPIFLDTKLYEPSFQSQPYFIYFGRLAEEKGLKILLKAMVKLKIHKLVIVGDGPQHGELKSYIQRKNLMNVEIVGEKHGDELHKLIKNSRFVVIPSAWYDNSPNVILEAYALGKPVLAANIGGIPEYVENANSGMLYNFDNVDELEEKIDFLMKQPNICKEMGNYAREKVLRDYNQEFHYEMLMKTISEIR